LIPNVDGVDVRNLPLPLPLDRVPAEKGVVFIDRSPKDSRFAAIKAQYPHGVEGVHRSTNGYIEFYSYQVEHRDLLAANPHAYIDHAPIRAVDLNKLNPQ